MKNTLNQSTESFPEKKINWKVIQREMRNKFGSDIYESWLRKKSLSSKITNSAIDDIYNNAIKRGALGGKLLGAGGGGFLLLYVPKNKQKNFFKYFNKFIHIPFNFENVGSKIIFKHNNK